MTSLTQLCREYGISYRLFRARYYDYGWELLEALETPVMSRKECLEKAVKQSAFNKRFIGDEKHNLYQTLDDAYYQRVRRAVKKRCILERSFKGLQKAFWSKTCGILINRRYDEEKVCFSEVLSKRMAEVRLKILYPRRQTTSRNTVC